MVGREGGRQFHRRRTVFRLDQQEVGRIDLAPVRGRIGGVNDASHQNQSNRAQPNSSHRRPASSQRRIVAVYRAAIKRQTPAPEFRDRRCRER